MNVVIDEMKDVFMRNQIFGMFILTSIIKKWDWLGQNTKIQKITIGGNEKENSKLLKLETFSVNNGGARFVVFLFADPHLLEGWKRSQDGATNPYGIFPLWGRNDLDFHGGWSQVGDLLLHAVGNARVHGGATGHDNIAVEVFPDVNIAFHDGVVGGLVDTGSLHTQEGRWE